MTFDYFERREFSIKYMLNGETKTETLKRVDEPDKEMARVLVANKTKEDWCRITVISITPL